MNPLKKDEAVVFASDVEDALLKIRADSYSLRWLRPDVQAIACFGSRPTLVQHSLLPVPELHCQRLPLVGDKGESDLSVNQD
ncbi:MAG: hypothetical protein ACFB8W_03405 [Elainellaceae cyanobacterium]